MDVSRMQRGILANGMAVKVNVEDDQLPWRKLHQMRVDELLNEHVDSRQDHCWLCDRAPAAWVREVVFDLGDDQDMPVRKTALAVDSRHYPGPVPGFCGFHLGSGPAELAERVYNSHEVITWGFRPTRWFVMFTDGTMARGAAMEIDPRYFTAPITHDKHTKGDNDDR